MPVRSLTCPNVSPARAANRSYAAASKKESESVPRWMAAPTASSGIPASSSDRRHQHPPHVAAREAIRLLGREDAELDQPVEVGGLDPDPFGGFLA